MSGVSDDLRGQLPEDWQALLDDELTQDYWSALNCFVRGERQRGQVFPPESHVFEALRLTPVEATRVVILGQDPYHDDGQAHGLSFSVRDGERFPPSLRNILRELADDLGAPPRQSGNLAAWARQGVLLLNTVLTVRAHEAHSHRGQGWERLTGAIVQRLGQAQRPRAFVLWGNAAQANRSAIAEPPHLVIASAHPSPLSARRGFFGSRPFSRINAWLNEQGDQAIDWTA